MSFSERLPRFLPFGLLLAICGLVFGLNFAPARAQVATPSPTPPGQIQLPTATNTQVGGPTATPSRTPTLVPVLVEAIGEANLRSGPGLDFEIVGQITAGNPVPVIGRSVQFPWYLVQWEDGEAWVFDQLVLVIGDITTIPIVDAPELPTQDPTQAAIEETATILIQTPGAAETATAAALFVPTGVFTATPGAEEAQGGFLPTFTPPPPFNQPEVLAEQPGRDEGNLIPPAALIVIMGGFGALMVIVGLVRRALIR
jgi:hypothetical protein